MAMAMISPGYTYVTMLMLALMLALRGKMFPGRLESVLLKALSFTVVVVAMIIFVIKYAALLGGEIPDISGYWGGL